LLRIGAHDEARDPPKDATHDNPYNKIHRSVASAV